MAISGELTEELVKFLQEHLKDKNDCKTHLRILFGVNNSILNEITWDTSLINIITEIIGQLDVYGKMQNSEYTALCKSLNLVSENVGEDVQQRINLLLQKIIREQEIITHQIQEMEIIYTSENLYDSLSKLNFFKQDNIFYDLIEASSIAAFLIHGEPEYGQTWLLNRLVHKYCSNSVKSKNVQISIGSLIKKNDVNSLLRQLAGELGLKGRQYTLSEIANGVNEWLKRQNVLLILNKVGMMPETNFVELMENFWRPLVSEIEQFQSQPSKYKLFMFLIDDLGYVKSWNNTNIFAETLNCDWKSQTPIKAPEITALLKHELEFWIRYEYKNLPSQLTKISDISQKILENSDNGVPELVLYQICDYCGYEWYVESKKWLKL